MQPTIYEILSYIFITAGVGFWFGWALYRDSHRKINDDPYRYCPQEEDE